MTVSIEFSNYDLYIKKNNDFLAGVVDNFINDLPISKNYKSKKLDILNDKIGKYINHERYAYYGKKNESYLSIIIKYNNRTMEFGSIQFICDKNNTDLSFLEKKENRTDSYFYIIDDLEFDLSNPEYKRIDYIKSYVENNDLFIKIIYEDFTEFEILRIPNYMNDCNYLDLSNNMLEYPFTDYEFVYHSTEENSTVQIKNKKLKNKMIGKYTNFDWFIFCIESYEIYFIIFTNEQSVSHLSEKEIKLIPKRKIKSAN